MDAIENSLTVSSVGKRKTSCATSLRKEGSNTQIGSNEKKKQKTKMSWRQTGSLLYKVEGEADFSSFRLLAEAGLHEQTKLKREKQKQFKTPRKNMHVALVEEASGSNGGEPVLEHMNIRPQAGQQAVNKADKRPLVVQEALPSRGGPGKTRSAVRKRQLVNTTPPARQEPEVEHESPRPPTGGGPVLEPMKKRPPAGEQDVNLSLSAQSRGRPRRPPTGQKPANRNPRALREGGRPTKSSPFKGVTHYRRTGRWEANIWHNGEQKYLGASATEIQAARAYDRALIHFRGADSDLNFNLDDYRGELRQLSTIRSEDLVTILRKQSKGVGGPTPDYQQG